MNYTEEKRRSGRTTRIVNNAIEQLFRGNTVHFLDHNNRKDEHSHRYALGTLKRRLREEHFANVEVKWNYQEGYYELKLIY
jgi:hypothetical protein